MPSKLPKVNFVLGEDELELVRSYQKQNGIKSLSKAFVELVSMGIRSEERRYADEDKLINAYRLLDDVGKSPFSRTLKKYPRIIKRSSDFFFITGKILVFRENVARSAFEKL